MVTMMIILAVAAAIITIAVAQIDPLCLPASTPGSDASFYCNSQNLPSEAAYLQLTVLAATQSYFVASFPDNYYCGWDTYGDRYGATIKLNSYASCSVGSSHDRQECERCLSFASEMIKERCPGTSGAQVGSDLCCIRYEEYGFC